MRTVKTAYFLLAAAFVISGCAYFNMYFNAKESFSSAEKKRLEKNITDKGLYENTIKELSKILEFYPESKWVDDALLLMGRSYMRLEDNYKAEKKFMELLSKYPDSELADQARILLSEVEIALRNYDLAQELMEGIRTDKLDIEPYRLLKLRADMSLSQGDSVKALNSLTASAREAESDADRISVLIQALELAGKMNDHIITAQISKELSDLSEGREKKFLYTLKYAEAVKEQGDLKQAQSILEKITGDEEFAEYSLKADIKLAGLYLDNAFEKEAYDKLDEILRTNPKDQKNGPDLSEASYYFGEFYFRLKKDFNAAETMYDSSGYYDRRNDFYQKAVSRKNLIRNYRGLRKKVEGYAASLDSSAARIDRETDEEKKAQLEKSKKTLYGTFIADKKELAETALYEMGLKDTALVLLEELSQETGHPHKASSAMLSLISADSIRYASLADSLLQKYPYTSGANFIRKSKGLEPVEVIEDSAAYFFNLSSQKFLDSLYSEASLEYEQIAKRFEDSPLSPKILQAAAMIEENYVKDLNRASALYSYLKDKYPQTAYGRFAAGKLKEEGVTVKKEEKKEEKVLSDSDKWYLMDRRNE